MTRICIKVTKNSKILHFPKLLILLINYYDFLNEILFILASNLLLKLS